MKTRILSLALVLIMAVTIFALPVATSPASALCNWTLMTTPGGIWENVWGASPTDVFINIGWVIYHYDGSSWTQQAHPETVGRDDIWGASGTNVWAVGGGVVEGSIWYYNGATWTVQHDGVANLLEGVWGSSATNVFAVGDNGQLCRFDGTAWTDSIIDAGSDFSAVWGSGPDNVFAVGEPAAIYRWNGTAWSKMATPDDWNFLYAVWGSGPNDVFAVGDNVIWHYDGASWTDVTPAGVNTQFTGIAGSSGNDIYAVGYNHVGRIHGLIWHYDGSSWSLATDDTGWGQLLDIWGGGGAYYTVACNGGGPLGGQVWRCMGTQTITATAHPFGTITPSGQVAVNNGANQTFTITANGFAIISDVQVDGRSVGAVSSYTFTNVTANHTINASFIPRPSGSGSSGGGISSNTGGPASQSPVNLASIQVQSATLSATKVGPGQAVTVTANVANKGTGNGTTAVKLYVNGLEESSKGVAVSSGSSTPVSFSVSRNEPGAYTVYVGGVSAGSFTVDQFADGNIVLYISGALLLVALIGGLIYFTRRRTVS